MESQTNIIKMMQLMDRPAFCVLDGIITGANQAALGRLVPLDQPVAPLLATGQTEYAAFADGLLYLTLEINGTHFGAAIHKVDEYHIFSLEPGNSDGELRVLSLAAQQLRNPLSSILSLTDRLFPNLERNEESPASEQIAYINRALHQMQRIINNMSDADRYCNAAPRLETRDVNAVIEELFEQAAHLCDSVNVRLEYTGLSTPAYSLIDSEQLERCIYNILSNALKFTPTGGSIEASLKRKNNILYLTIQDSGSGISQNVAGHLFTRYLREPAIEDKNHGLGLGMSLIRSCACAHGGTVLVESAKDQGLRLTMSLPIRLDTTNLRSPSVRIDYAGERHHGLIELSDSLPHALYKPHKR